MSRLLILAMVLALSHVAQAATDGGDSGLFVVTATCQAGHRSVPGIAYNFLPWRVRYDAAREV
ncbi:MAG: hypothetical protein ACREAC_13390 [Blastocatellia bacterium]